MRLTRRRLIGIGGGLVAAVVGARFALPWLLRRGPAEKLSAGAIELIARAFESIDRTKMWDLHVHLVGLGAGGTGCWVNPDMMSFWSPVKQLKFDVYMAAAGIEDEATADPKYLERLLWLHRETNPDGKLVVLGFDYHVREDGSEDHERSEFYTPNDYAIRVASEHDDVVAGVSIHPYRSDAVARLDEAAAAGAKLVKWLPNAMGIDPAAPACDPFYRRLAELGLPLLTHTGEEQAVDSSEAQRLGNPLRLRRALDAGVKVVAAHCASFGSDEDLDAPGDERPVMESFDLFMRLMTDRQYENNLFADVSALTQVNRCGRPLRETLMAGELHHRLVNGSDYPLPAVDPLFNMLLLEQRGYLTDEEGELCSEIFEANPLLFDFVLKRTVKVETGGSTHRFADRVFETAWLFGG